MNKRFRCRTHQGGIFSIPARQGRPPVRCTDAHPCDKADEAAQPAATPRTTVNDSLPLATATKARLEALEWVVKGKAWVVKGKAWVGTEDAPHDPAGQWAEIVCSRGAETLIVIWRDGVLQRQDYQMESIRAADNDIPPHTLTFNPEEVTDSELARMISGMKVTWWNSLAGSRETAIVSSKVNIEHIFVGGGDTDNSKRIVKFIDYGGGGFRAFHAGALLKVG